MQQNSLNFHGILQKQEGKNTKIEVPFFRVAVIRHQELIHYNVLLR